ncbi:MULTISPECIES: tetraacyldisaccharide 4'-kinase [unclassified Francisella]|uniref:tetraacyldisaccharide 4'-kinase n=1 Tax=unclassified Francisella TaxID=2610885 RepID=UPI002E333EBF|nr:MULTISPECIES: tetraacyldisaccharide 4'-kinase [unclassified Francisella]MED7819649.1 tetraacyldisaccharide 4'-kinase [Francisella sp. 19S2-4]MED7830480.1 tetraacyldisaccharide 4'-kinase [Francisella sp. 19S2-10]
MIDKFWYQRNPNLLSCILKPISIIFSKVATNRKLKQQQNQYKSKIPVVIVGNISVGGTGKTPVVRKLAQEYLAKGKNPVIISRGYGAKAESYPFEVNSATLASQCGDEPAMLYDALNGQVPIIISPQRVDSVKYIEKIYPNTDVIISDDGLQHYKLARDKEIVVVDASRMFGNQLCIPAGPLRESIERLSSVDEVIIIGDCSEDDKKFLRSYNQNITFAKIVATEFVNLVSGARFSKDEFSANNIVAVVGIGNPEKFFETLAQNNIKIEDKEIFKDHHKFVQQDFSNIKDNQAVIMTYKDAIKCKSFARENWWYLDIELQYNQ